jgi:peptidoglycan/LPS O-acetylase OafA/YrhL
MVGYMIANWTFLSSGGDVVPYNCDFLLCGAVGMLAPNIKDMRESFVSDASQLVARYSYGIYLVHVPVIWLAFVRLNRSSTVTQWLAFTALMVALPLLTYHFIEAPMVHAGQWLTNRRPVRSTLSARSLTA